MLTAADNELICRVGPGTPMGEYLRQYWMPVLRSEAVEPGGDPVQARVLATDIVVFRGNDGSLGCVDAACPHRRASLALAYNDGTTIKCLYHGWQFDTSGVCVNVPTEPADKRADFAARVKVARHATAEAGGMIWVHLGDPDNPPPLPDFEFNHLPAGHVRPMVGITPVNWVQCLEGLVDTVHVGQLHQEWLPGTTTKLADVTVESAPRYEIAEAPYGLRACADRARAGGDHYVRITEYIAPFWSFIPHGPKEDRVSMGIIPIDDTHTMQWYIWYDHNAPLDEDTGMANRAFKLLFETPDDFTSSVRGKPKWGQDRATMGRTHFTGISNIVLEDIALQESQGDIMDRTQEHLGSSDQFVTRTRRLLIKSARQHSETGEVFPAPGTPLRDIRAMAVDISDGDDWREIKPS